MKMERLGPNGDCEVLEAKVLADGSIHVETGKSAKKARRKLIIGANAYEGSSEEKLRAYAEACRLEGYVFVEAEDLGIDLADMMMFVVQASSDDYFKDNLLGNAKLIAELGIADPEQSDSTLIYWVNGVKVLARKTFMGYAITASAPSDKADVVCAWFTLVFGNDVQMSFSDNKVIQHYRYLREQHRIRPIPEPYLAHLIARGILRDPSNARHKPDARFVMTF